MHKFRERQFWTICLFVLSAAVWSNSISRGAEDGQIPKAEPAKNAPRGAVGQRQQKNLQAQVGELTRQIARSSRAGDIKSELHARKALVALYRNEYGPAHWKTLEEHLYVTHAQRTSELDADKQAHTARVRLLCAESDALRRAGLAESALSRVKNALNLCRPVLGESDIMYVTILTQVGYLQQHLHRYKDSKSSYSKALALRLRLIGERTPNDAPIMNNLAHVHIRLNELKMAETLLVTSSRIIRLNRPRSLLHGIVKYQLAKVCNLRKKFPEAQSAAAEASGMFNRFLPRQYPYYMKSQLELARSYMGQNKFVDAATAYERIVRLCRSFRKPYQPPAEMRIELFEEYASALDAKGDNSEAKSFRAQAAELRLEERRRTR